MSEEKRKGFGKPIGYHKLKAATFAVDPIALEDLQHLATEKNVSIASLVREGIRLVLQAHGVHKEDPLQHNLL